MIRSPYFLMSCLVVIGVAIYAKLSFPWTGVDLELYPAYQKTQLYGDWKALVLMDKSTSPDFRMPYAGWPPLYGMLLVPLAIFGADYALGVICLNVCLLFAAFGFLWRLFIISKIDFSTAQLSLAFLLSPGLLGFLSMGFAHWLVPLVSLMVLWGYETSHQGRGSWPCWVLSFGLGVIAGLSNWMVYFIYVALALLLLWSAFRRGSLKQQVLKDRERWVWVLIGGITAGSVFVFWNLWLKTELHAGNVLEFALSGNEDTLKRRMLPGLKGYAMALWNGSIRGAFALIGMAVFLLLAKRMQLLRWRQSTPFPLSWHALWLSPLCFFVVFPGEMAPSAHGFHRMVFAVPVIALLAYFSNFFEINNQRLLRGQFVVALGVLLFSFLSYRLLPVPWMFRADSGAAKLVDTIVRNGLVVPENWREQQSDPESQGMLAEQVLTQTKDNWTGQSQLIRIHPAAGDSRYMAWKTQQTWIKLSENEQREFRLLIEKKRWDSSRFLFYNQ